MVYINGRFLSQRITGIQRFAYEICCALQQIGTEFTILAPTDIRDEYDLTGLSVEVIWGKGSHFWEQVTLPRYMRKHYNGQLLLSLSGLSPISYSCNIMTIHDVSYMLRPRAYSWAYCAYYRLMTPLAARRARKILTVSQFSKTEIIKYLTIPPQKITVVYNAVRQGDLQPRETAKKYILAVGSLMPRKNIKRLLEAYSIMQDADFELWVAGGINASFANAELDTFAQIKGMQLLGYVQADELTRLYRNATAYINPSLYEGFGIPLVEAMTQECPLVVSDIPVFHEVCGKAAMYFNPLDVADIREKMETIMHDEPLRQQLVKEGTLQVTRFSWEQSAKKIEKLINEL